MGLYYVGVYVDCVDEDACSFDLAGLCMTPSDDIIAFLIQHDMRSTVIAVETDPRTCLQRRRVGVVVADVATSAVSF